MPLSIPFLVFAFISGASMRQLRMAGILPAFVAAIILSLVCVWYGKKTGCDNGSARSTRREMWEAFKDAGPALLMPVIIVGGIWSELFTPTEAAAVSVVYGLVVSLVVYGDITWRDLPHMLLRALRTSSVVMLIIGATGALANLVHFGVVITFNLAIALVHPPVGAALFISAKLAEVSIGAVTKALLPLLAAMILILLLITYIEPLSLVLIRLTQ